MLLFGTAAEPNTKLDSSSDELSDTRLCLENHEGLTNAMLCKYLCVQSQQLHVRRPRCLETYYSISSAKAAQSEVPRKS
jgi:hypothetical protein